MSTGDPPAIRAVLDANVLIRFFLTPRGGNAQLLVALDEGTFKLVTSETILAEVADVLGRPHVQRYGPFSKEQIVEAVSALRDKAAVVECKHEVIVPIKDPKDRHVLACAVDGQADFIVTDDRKHLLPLKKYEGIPLLPPPLFLEKLRSR